MNCKWCFTEIEGDNQAEFQFCSNDCKMMHPFGQLADDINQAIDNGANEQELLLFLNRNGILPQLPEPQPEPEPEPLPDSGFDK